MSAQHERLTELSATGAAGPYIHDGGVRRFLFSYGRNHSDNQPTRHQCTWPEFVTWLQQQQRRPASVSIAEYPALKARPAKSPEGERLAADKDGAYVVLADCGGGRRALESLQASYGVPLDFDVPWVTADVIAALLHGYTFVAYTTYAHQPGAERWRVFVPTSAPMDAATHYATWEALNDLFGGAADPAAKDPVRLSYLPGSCLDPSAARVIHGEGAFYAAVPAPPAQPQEVLQSVGPVPGWNGPTDDAELIRIACATRTRPDERFGGPVHFAMLWGANEVWLAQQYPPRPDSGQPWDMTQADMALAGELAYWTGSDAPRMATLIRSSGLARNDADWQERKVPRAVERAVRGAKQWAFMASVPAPAPGVGEHGQVAALIDRTDAGNAALLIQLADGALRYVAETKQWLRWTGTRWQLDEHEVFVTTHALEVARHYLTHAATLEREVRIVDADTTRKWAAKCRSKAAIDNMVTLARKSAGVPISVNELDRDPWLLGVENGVIDLRTGTLRPDARDELVTKRCRIAYDPRAQAPRWEQFIAEITGTPHGLTYIARPDLARYLQKALGYSITGSTKEQKFFLAIGAGSNGKNVVFDAVKRVLGDYSRTLTAEALMASDRAADAERPTATAASLAGARFVLASETKDGQTLDVGALKNHTGDEEMTARRMRENPFTFTITHHLWLMTNHRPALAHVDAAVRGRLHLIPFDRRWNRPGESERDPSLPDGDKDLAVTLGSEAPGILTWLVRGTLLYLDEGLTPPAAVVSLTREYVQDQDHMGRWLATMRQCAARDGMLASELFSTFCHWCSGEGVSPKPGTQTAFSIALTNRGIEKHAGKRGNSYGIAL